jgi:hypothetical protein
LRWREATIRPDCGKSRQTFARIEARRGLRPGSIRRLALAQRIALAALAIDGIDRT